MSIVPMAWLLETTGQFPVLISIYHGDGTVVISHGGIEMGQGINTKVRPKNLTHLLFQLERGELSEKSDQISSAGYMQWWFHVESPSSMACHKY